MVRFQSTINQLTALEKERLAEADDFFLKIQQRKLKQTYQAQSRPSCCSIGDR